MKTVTPSVKETAFNCPHCGVLAMQYWYDVFAKRKNDEDSISPVIDDTGAGECVSEAHYEPCLGADVSSIANTISVRNKLKEERVWHAQIASCFNCSKISFWISSQLVHPKSGEAPLANPDMPSDVRGDYEEASRILDQSPRGAAALIRLAIQKLCKHLGQPGRNINDDIGALVRDGLDVRVQKAFDAVRVIGNNAVHPGQIDLRDDRGTAETLFKLLNLVVEKTITEPKHVQDVYDSLPQGALKAIEKRDGKK